MSMAANYRKNGKTNIADALERQAQRELEKPAMDVNDVNSEAVRDKYNNPSELATPMQQPTQQVAQQPVQQPVQQAEQYQQPNAFGGAEQAPTQPVASAEPQTGISGYGGTFAEPEPAYSGFGGTFAEPEQNSGYGGTFDVPNADLGSGTGGAFPKAKNGYLNNGEDYAALLKLLANSVYTD